MDGLLLSCLSQSWSLQSGGSLRMERILKRSEIIWTSVGRWGTNFAILDRVNFWPLQILPSLLIVWACRWDVGRVELADRRLFNALSSSW